MEEVKARNRALTGIGKIVGGVKKFVNGETIELHIEEKQVKSKLTVARKRNLIEERGRMCEWCGKKYPEWVFEVHHIIPREYKECSDKKENLLVLCANDHREFSHKWDEIRRHAKKGENIELTLKEMREISEYIIE